MFDADFVAALGLALGVDVGSAVASYEDGIEAHGAALCAMLVDTLGKLFTDLSREGFAINDLSFVRLGHQVKDTAGGAKLRPMAARN